MSDSGNSAADHALLARLNALRRSTVDLEAKRLPFQPTGRNSSIDPAPARALHGDLLSRFIILSGQGSSQDDNDDGYSKTQGLTLPGDEDGKTVEDLLAELGPEDSWQVGKNEEDDINQLLQAAKSSLNTQTNDISSNSPEPHRSHDDARTSNRAVEDLGIASSLPAERFELTEDELDCEADEYVAQVLGEIKTARKSISPEPQDSDITPADPLAKPESSNSATRTALPSAPQAELEPPSYSDITADDALASRFANLGLPSVPTTIKTQSSQPAAEPPQTKGFTDEEIDSWCIICNEDATLSCKGCDGDLYCTNCWLEGHKGPDAGYDERTHKAVQYVKGGGLKKQPARPMLGA